MFENAKNIQGYRFSDFLFEVSEDDEWRCFISCKFKYYWLRYKV